MLKVLIADDEPLARETIMMLLADVDDISEVRQAQDGNAAIREAAQFSPDIVFLDIEMPGLSGLEVAKALPASCTVIFVTAYNEHAVRAFELNAIDYLLKPFDDHRFYRALEKVRQRRTSDSIQGGDLKQISSLLATLGQKSLYRERLVIREPGRIRLIDVDQIMYITGAGNYAELHLSDGKVVLHRETLSVLDEQLDPEHFVRIHRSSIVRRNMVTELRPNDKGDYQVILSNGEQLTLSRRNRAKLEVLTC
ncbi:LytR/AlgR family response regulator transcription factor [Aestuariibacter salexigens]|uniref:LytR/AlgR family response regulator transcription factor n=1 Tax=Aestuariibacter salexigens TaxID=226010 RepID=UPI00041E2D0D|nr:LytTR family DNA-binding domain-containing protein [Aestuariibacter salexigens]